MKYTVQDVLLLSLFALPTIHALTHELLSRHGDDEHELSHRSTDLTARHGDEEDHDDNILRMLNSRHGDDEDHDESIAARILARHGDDEHAEHDHDHDHDHDPQGTGHGHNMSHGAFNFTPSGIPWPTCTRECCNAFFGAFPEPVNHPLCVSQPFFNNVTGCVAQNCTEFEQGAFAVLAEIECPAGQEGNISVQAARAALVEAGGTPQDCSGQNNATIQCNNGSSAPPPEEFTGIGMKLANPVWLGSVAILTALYGMML